MCVYPMSVVVLIIAIVLLCHCSGCYLDCWCHGSRCGAVIIGPMAEAAMVTDAVTLVAAAAEAVAQR